MTRLNLVPPNELMDQHLFAEFREIKMIPMSLARSLRARGEVGVLKMIPKEFTLNKGHVSFFYDKYEYLKLRYQDLRYELFEREINFNVASKLDPTDVYLDLNSRFLNDYEPTSEAIALVRARIAERIAVRPGWYRYYGRIYYESDSK